MSGTDRQRRPEADHRHSRKRRSREAEKQARYRQRDGNGRKVYRVEAHENDLAGALQAREEARAAELGIPPKDLDLSHRGLEKALAVMAAQFIDEWLPECQALIMCSISSLAMSNARRTLALLQRQQRKSRRQHPQPLRSRWHKAPRGPGRLG